MKRITLIGLAALAAATVSTPAMAEEKGWGLLPVVNDAAYKPNFSVALKGGMMDTDVSGVDQSFAYGIELALDCPLIRTPVGKIRQQLSYNRMDNDGLELQTLELNPHLMFPVTSNLSVGAGPGVAYVWADSNNGADANMWAVNLGASATYTMDKVLLGAEVRHQWTQDDSIGTSRDGADNWLATVKVGYQF